MPLSTSDRRTLAAGASAIALLLVLGHGAPALHAWTARQQRTAAARERELLRLERAVRGQVQIRHAAASARAQLAAYRDALLGGASHADAGAQLAKLVSDAAETSESQLGSVQVQGERSIKRGAALARVAARATLRGDLASLALFLSALEEGPAFVAVRELAIAEGDAGIPATRRESLRMDVLVEGFYEPASRRGADSTPTPRKGAER